jgi:CubicO group peptidase (beta-lactamase class C family)
VGGILEGVTDTNFESLVEKRLLQPLEMQRSTFSRRTAKESGFLSRSYAEADGKVALMDFIDTSYLAPSAGLYSNAREMVKWVDFNINKGRIGDRQLVSEKSMAWVHRPHMVVGAVPDFKSQDVTYGQGWFRSQHRGRLLISHGGSFNGHRTTIAFIPELDLGVVALCNLNLTEFPELLVRVVFDRFLGTDALDEWNEHYGNLKNARHKRKRAAGTDFHAGRRLESKPRHELAAYTGTYTHPGYGTFIVAMHANGLVQTYDGRSFPLQPYDGETFGTRWQSTENNLLHLPMRFHSDKEGRVVAVVVPLIPGIPPQRFVRQ